ncbi:maleylpyruvate isomerase family mycothiol-dependent enzyme [Phytoactinopolyspora endophytica]|uniref:maleylpyruvate isomerase family mycothiol-dependent enzyme n=1 Tax=Phytoactinopolyspora endophytica TaxID=1642495 RepID=UPI00101CD36E|nr:maleylpyruvate isomerase family mycothiol-dependent enzyme [Phytoactinopolyspora endophytica]
MTDSDESAGPVTAATDRLIATASALDAETLTGPSLCPGWTRAHVLTHVARSADALTNLLVWARTGVETPAYTSREARQADIEAGAGRSLDDLIDDLQIASDTFATAVTELPADAWRHEVRIGAGNAGKNIPARRTLWLRLQEVEVHHVDLDAGYGWVDWPELFVKRALPETVRNLGQREDAPEFTLMIDGAAARIGTGNGATVSGSARPILAWLLGRSSGTDLETSANGSLPSLPALL